MSGNLLVQEGGLYWAKLEGVHVRLKVLSKPDNPFGLWRCEAPAPFNYQIQVPEAAFVEACAPSDAGS